MALILAEPFDIYRAVNNTASNGVLELHGWTLTQTGALTYRDGRFSGAASLEMTSVSGILKSVAAHTTGIVQFALRPSAIPGSNTEFMRLRNSAGTTLILFGMTSAGAIYAARAGGTIIGTTSTTLFATSWHHVQIKYVVSNTTTGSIEIKIDGVTALNVGSVQTSDTSGSVEQFRMGFGVTLRVADLIMMDTTGSEMNDFIGDVRFRRLAVTSDVIANWTPSTGSDNYAMLDETVRDTADYVSTFDAEADLYGVANLTSAPTSIKGVFVMWSGSRTNTETVQVRPLIKSNVTTSNGTTRTLASDGIYSDFWALDPDTSAAWTIGGVDALQVGIERL